MSMIKICPSCKLENGVSEMFCVRCSADISAVTPTEKGAPKEILPSSSETVIERPNTLELRAFESSRSLHVNNGEILGREAGESEFFAEFPTVSRRHAKFTFAEKWFVEDLNATNGTWLNERRLEPGEKFSLKSGDRLGLSRSCVFVVK